MGRGEPERELFSLRKRSGRQRESMTMTMLRQEEELQEQLAAKQFLGFELSVVGRVRLRWAVLCCPSPGASSQVWSSSQSRTPAWCQEAARLHEVTGITMMDSERS